MHGFLIALVPHLPKVNGITGDLLDRLDYWEPRTLASTSTERAILEAPAAEAITALSGENGHVEIRILGEILSVPDAVSSAIRDATTVHLEVNSFGGSSRASWELLDLLDGKNASVHVQRVAGSAAATVATLCSGRRTIHPGGFVMLHRNRGLVLGTGDRLREAAVLMDHFDGVEIRRLSRRTGRPRREVKRWLAEPGSWICAPEALEFGLVDEVVS